MKEAAIFMLGAIAGGFLTKGGEWLFGAIIPTRREPIPDPNVTKELKMLINQGRSFNVVDRSKIKERCEHVYVWFNRLVKIMNQEMIPAESARFIASGTEIQEPSAFLEESLSNDPAQYYSKRATERMDTLLQIADLYNRGENIRHKPIWPFKWPAINKANHS